MFDWNPRNSVSFACSKIGAVANFINPLFETKQKIDRINDTGSDTIFVLDKMYKYVKDVIPQTNICKIVIISAYNALPIVIKTISKLKSKLDSDIEIAFKSGNFIFWNDYIKNRKNLNNAIVSQYKKDQPMIMVYSSGTTGTSKGIVLTNDSINATITQYEMGLFSEGKRGNRFLHNVPIWFSTGVSISLLMPLCLGATCILEPIFSPESFLNDIIKYKPNYALVATGLWLYVIDHLDDSFDLSFLKCPITGGEQMLGTTEIFINDYLKNTDVIQKYKTVGECANWEQQSLPQYFLSIQKRNQLVYLCRLLQLAPLTLTAVRNKNIINAVNCGFKRHAI